MDSIINTASVLAILLCIGALLGLLRPKAFSLRWLLIAVGLVLLNDLMLTRAYGLIPDIFPASDWNWTGKILALAATLLMASLPGFGWSRTGLTLRQSPGSLKACLLPMILYMGFFLAIALAFPSDSANLDTAAFQLTMPGIEEETFYRGILLFALGQAFTGRWTFLGVDWGWSALLSSMVFGLAHAFSYSDGHFAFEPMIMALTAIPSLLGVWLVLKTRSVLTPVILHNFGNAIGFLI